jgi:hypothetical protein
MSWSSISITRHYEADIFRNKHSIKPEGGHGFDHDKMSEEEAIALAIKEKIPVIVKAGPKAKWYFKGKDVPYDTLMQMINDSKGKINSNGKELHKNKYIILIKFD